MSEMMKKELKEEYRNRTVIGGVYSIKCDITGSEWVKVTKDLSGQRNKFNFAVMTNSCLDNTMNKEWNQYGPTAFSFTVLEELKKAQAQTESEFKADLDLLRELWIEKKKDERQMNHPTI